MPLSLLPCSYCTFTILRNRQYAEYLTNNFTTDKTKSKLMYLTSDEKECCYNNTFSANGNWHQLFF